ncbi:regulator of chromosome condensation 1/beta-lactamase-inhibitor protein II [Powellomyces hirtus]|nr:regulator of chromosome condensation 1/beta-lactamase-inhibitor protein II [Powellomyces hirtus]
MPPLPSPGGPPTLESLSFDALACVLQRLPAHALCTLSTASKQLHKACNEEYLWKRLCVQDFRVQDSVTFRALGWKVLYSRLRSPVCFTWGGAGNETIARDGHHMFPGRVEALDQVGVVQICCMGWGMMALSRTGSVYVWGRLNGNSYYGNAGEQHDRPTPVRHDHGRIRQIAGGRFFGVVLADSGIGYVVTSVSDVLHMEQAVEGPPMRITHVAAGWAHALALTEEGHILEYTNPERPNYPAQHPPPAPGNKWVQVAGGEGFTVALTRNGDVYRWETGGEPAFVSEVSGKGYTHLSAAFRHYALFKPPSPQRRSGEQAPVQVFSNHTAQFSPVCLPDRETLTGTRDRIIQMSFGDWHSACLSEQGDIYTWGGDGGGQLGHGTGQNEDTPRLVRLLKEQSWFVFQVACGGWHTACLAVRVQ